MYRTRRHVFTKIDFQGLQNQRKKPVKKRNKPIFGRCKKKTIKNPANGKTAASALRDRSNTRPIWAPGEPERRIKEAGDKNWNLDEW